jgi:hypothetical protein
MSIANYSTRWKEAEERNDYRTWLALSDFLASLSSEAVKDNSLTIAADLWKSSREAWQRAVDLEPKQEAA